jgi:tRNA(Arg) A34 adenosine deaminase TadA
VKGGTIIGRGANHVTSLNDPTAHAEIMAIRDACQHLGTFQLKGCTLYTSCEPCPMCLGAIYWARPDALYFANSKEDAAAIHFDDHFIYQELEKELKDRHLSTYRLNNSEAIKVFAERAAKEDKILY